MIAVILNFFNSHGVEGCSLINLMILPKISYPLNRCKLEIKFFKFLENVLMAGTVCMMAKSLENYLSKHQIVKKKFCRSFKFSATIIIIVYVV